MEQSINYLKEILQSLNLEKSEDDDAESEIFAGSKRMMSKAKNFLEDNVSTIKSQMPELGLADLELFTWNGFEEEGSDNKSGVITRVTLDSSGLSEISNVSSDELTGPPRCLKKGKKLREKETSVKKIAALEDELADLRAQIAMIVSHQEKTPEQVTTIAPPPPPLPPQMIPATPPPPPPPVVPKILPKINKPKNLMKSKAQENGVPSMADVLAGLSAVKLKAANVKRSPGGTPLKVRSQNRQSSSQDPADVIANALRKKFAKARKSIGSPCKDKENQWSPHAEFSPSPAKCIDVSYLSPVTSSPEALQKSRRRSNTVPGRRIVLSPVNEN
eukprot:gene7689-13512_t